MRFNTLRPCSLLLATFLFSTLNVAAQTVPSNVIRRHMHRLLEEKVRWPHAESTIAWLRQHPGQLPPESVTAPTPNASIQRSAEVVINDDEKAESEVHAAINPTDTSNIIVSAIVQDPGNFLAPLDISVYYTKNFGQSWQSSTIVFNPGGGLSAGGGDPVLAFDADGTAYLTWLVLSLDLFAPVPLSLSLYAATSANQGQTWSAPILIDAGEASIEVLLGTGGDGSLVDKQWMDVDRSSSPQQGSLYVSYTRFDIIDSTNATARILLKKKPSNSSAFNAAAVQVHQGTYNLLQFSSLDVDDAGQVHVLFFAGNTDADIALYHSVSTDGGATFGPEVKISGMHFSGLLEDTPGNSIEGMAAERLYPCPHLRAGKTPGLLFATWSADGIQAQESEGFDVWFSRSTDHGQNWSAPVSINAGDDPLAEQFYPALDVNPNGTVCLSYYDRSDDPAGTSTNYVVAYSFDDGLSFTAAVPASLMASDFSSIGGLNGGFGIGEYTQIVSTSSYAIPVWSDGRANNGDIDLYAAFLPIGETVSAAGEVGTVTDAFAVRAPNPARGTLALEIQLNETSQLSVRVFSADGRAVYENGSDVAQAAGVYRQAVPLKPGIYVCRVETDFGFKLRRIVVE